MKPIRCAVLCLLACVFCVAAWAKPADYKTGAAAAWVVPVSPLHPTAATPLPPRGGVAYLLQDYQTRVDQRGKVTYLHVAKRALDSSGVEKVASISISYDPTYQSLTLHAINVIRDGKLTPRLASAKVHVLQRETELESQIYDGSMTASVMLDDVRIGDIVEYAYSVDGNNPVFQNKVAGKADLEWAVPVEHAFVRLLVPSSRPVWIAPRHSKLKPQLQEADGYRDYRWELHNVPELRVDSGAPDWYDPYASVQWTEFRDWAEVARWALPLYRPQRDMSEALRREVERIAREHADPAGRVAEVLKLVQRDVRYLGIEVGPGSHAPTAPSTVFQRRFGDCKDKALLVVTMLDALGIDAAPALVNTVIAREVATLAPTPTAFNHVLVRVRTGGKLYWLDPTRALQQGDLEHLYQPDYGYALVLEPGAAGLSPMAGRAAPRKTVRAVFDASAGLEQPVGYTVTTTFEGRGADSLRDQLVSNKAELVTQYQNFYARSYAGIRADGELKVQDDAPANALTLVESYRIAGFWERSGKRGRLEANIEASDVTGPLKAPDAISRNAPLRLEYPNNISEVTEVRLPERWNLKSEKAEVHDAAFEFSYEVAPAADGKSVRITANYRALSDHVDPGDMGNYTAHLKKAREMVGYQLYTTVPGEQVAGEAPAASGSRLGMSGWLLGLTALAAVWLRRVLLPAGRSAVPEHREVNRRLALAASLLAAMFVLIGVSAIPLRYSLPVSAVVLAMLAKYLWEGVPLVPATHPAYRWARRCYGLRSDPLTMALWSLARKLPPLLGWLMLGSYAAQVLSR